MTTIQIAAIALALALSGSANAQTAGDAAQAGAQVVAMTSFPDGRIALTFQKERTVVICVMERPSGTTITTQSCHTVK